MTRSLLSLAFLAAAGAAIPAGATAQSPPPWRAWVGLEAYTFDTDLPQWEDWLTASAGIQRSSEWGALGVEVFRSRRFGLRDEGAAAEAYIQTLDRGYAHVRGQVVPDAVVLPSADLRLELFQGFGDGWEASAAARRLVVSGESIAIYGLGLARYLPAWYLRARFDVNPTFEETALYYSASVRRYLSRIEGFLELAGGTGEEVAEVAAGPVVDLRAGTSLTARAELFPYRRAGVAAGITYATLEDLPTRYGGDVRLIIRW